MSSIKTFFKFAFFTVGTSFVGLSIVARLKKGDSVYQDSPLERNPFEGKKVIFKEDADNGILNADGVMGQLEATGNTCYIPGFYERYVKRGIDIILSFGGLLFLSPILGAIAVAIKVEDPGPVFFTQKRVGKNKQYFKLHKFRSMKMCTPHDVPTHMLENPDQYITKVGKFLRSHSLDELPQIWDIFVGNMSVIGPRPGLWNQDLLTAERDKYGANDVKPGLTGLAQINGRDELYIQEKAKLDGEYVHNIGFKTDINIFLRSLHVLGGDDSVVEGGIKQEKIAQNENKFQHEIESTSMVSIIMPAHNAAKTIKDAINSVINQSYKNWELIIINDCSQDDTEEIIMRYVAVDKRIVYLKNDSNQGVAITRNIGLEQAVGKYIAFLDSDDLWCPEKLKRQIDFMENKGIAFCFTSYQKFQNETGKLGPIIKAPMKIEAEDILGNTIIGCLTVMYNSEVIGKEKMPKLMHMEDNITWYNILSKGYTAYGINEVLALYREGNSSLTNNKIKAAIQQWQVYRDYFGFSIPKSIRLFSSYAVHAIVKHKR